MGMRLHPRFSVKVKKSRKSMFLALSCHILIKLSLHFPPVLSFVHGLIGSGKQLFIRHTVIRTERNADTDRDKGETLAGALAYVVHQQFHLLLGNISVADAFHISDKLIPSGPAQYIIGAERLLQAIGQKNKGAVTGGVTKLIVDLFEIIHIDHKEGAVGSVLDAFSDFCLG